ncbi:hypothetical protein V6N11_075343 [Hibiscus sabdariffa]|uniref:Secreted protein n=1 Tax=Hibiscus sabdariffa TaxID=183260 RepID=A0ABR2R6E7_9ROSI
MVQFLGCLVCGLQRLQAWSATEPAEWLGSRAIEGPTFCWVKSPDGSEVGWIRFGEPVRTRDPCGSIKPRVLPLLFHFLLKPTKANLAASSSLSSRRRRSPPSAITGSEI